MHEEEQEVDATHRVEAGPGQEVLPGTTTRWRPDSPARDGHGPDCSRQRGNEDSNRDAEEDVRHIGAGSTGSGSAPPPPAASGSRRSRSRHRAASRSNR